MTKEDLLEAGYKFTRLQEFCGLIYKVNQNVEGLVCAPTGPYVPVLERNLKEFWVTEDVENTMREYIDLGRDEFGPVLSAILAK